MLGAAVGLPLAVGGFAVIVAILVLWGAAVLSLFAVAERHCGKPEGPRWTT